MYNLLEIAMMGAYTTEKLMSGKEERTYDCGDYEVKLIESSEHTSAIEYVNKKTGTSMITPFNFKIQFDEEEMGGKIEIEWINGWGSKMIFIHYKPSDLEGMFDFIGKGYNILPKLLNE